MTKQNKPETTHSPVSENPIETPARRSLLKKLAAGGTVAALVPTQWSTPVIKLATLPAHATATCGACDSGVLLSCYENRTDTTTYVEVDAWTTADAGCNGGDVFAQLLFGGSPVTGIGSETNNPSEAVATSCNGSVCMATVSLWAFTTQVPSAGGASLTVRFTWPGGCTTDIIEFADSTDGC